MALSKKDVQANDANPNPPMSDSQRRSLKKKQIIGICVVSLLLVIAIVLTVLTYTVWSKK